MRTLARVASEDTVRAEPLPTVFPMLPPIPRGLVTMIAASPAAGKTFVTSKLVLGMKVPTLVFSADTDESTIVERMLAIITGERQSEIRAQLRTSGKHVLADILADETNHIRWCFNQDPSQLDLDLETSAYAEMYGAYPECIVIDNLMNLLPETDNEFSSLEDGERAIKRLGRITDSAIIVLHHMNRPDSKKEDALVTPAPVTRLRGGIDRLPELILSMAFNNMTGEMHFATVKHRKGSQDQSGQSYETIYADLDRGQFYVSRYNRDHDLPI